MMYFYVMFVNNKEDHILFKKIIFDYRIHCTEVAQLPSKSWNEWSLWRMLNNTPAPWSGRLYAVCIVMLWYLMFSRKVSVSQ